MVIAWLAFPRTIRLAVRDDPVTQVAHPIVPVVVIGPPVIGLVVAMLLTEPVPPGTAHVPSPRQKVVALALVPELSLVTARFPLVLVDISSVGISLATRARKEGTAAPPLVGPASTRFALCGVIVNVRSGVDVGEVTTALK